jgi:hypothetical protein
MSDRYQAPYAKMPFARIGPAQDWVLENAVGPTAVLITDKDLAGRTLSAPAVYRILVDHNYGTWDYEA